MSEKERKITPEDIRCFHKHYIRLLKDVGIYPFMIKRITNKENIVKDIVDHSGQGLAILPKELWSGFIKFYWQPIVDYIYYIIDFFADEEYEGDINKIGKIIACVSLIEIAKNSGQSEKVIEYGKATELEYLSRMVEKYNTINVPKKFDKMFFDNEILTSIRNARI